MLSGSELDPCATAAGGDTDAALEEHLPDSLTLMRRSYNNGSDPKEFRAVRKVRRHLCAQERHDRVLPIDNQNVRIRISERLPQPTLRFRLRCGVSQIGQ